MANKVYISEYLRNTYRGKPVYDDLKTLEKKGKITLAEIPNNKNEWCRDYMPVKGSNSQLTLFKYRPPYLIGSESNEKTIPDQKAIVTSIHPTYADLTEIIMDGGAIEIFEKKGIISDRVVSENSSKWIDFKPEVLERIRLALALDVLIVVPSDPWDFTGHVDGMVRFINGQHVLINDMTGVDKTLDKYTRYEQEQYSRWKINFLDTLNSSGLKVSSLTCAMHKNSKDEDATGIYLNFLILDDLIIMPNYGGLETENEEARMQLKELYNKEVYPIRVDKVAEKGGAINCITWKP